MATNKYFNAFPSNITNEQLLIEDMVIESIKQYGMDVYYIPRESRDQIDYLYGEDVLKKFSNAYEIEMYMENVLGMEGGGDLISKFGLEISDETTLLVSRRRFVQTVPRSISHRPREGDLIYIPMVQNFFEITFVEHENEQAMFYTLGRGRGGNVYLYALRMKQYVFSEEPISTGIQELDEQAKEEYRKTLLVLNTGTGAFVANEIVYQGNSLATANSKAITHSWDVSNNKLYVTQTVGVFKTENGPIKGSNSNASWNLADDEDKLTPFDNPFEDITDNNRIQTESNVFLDFSESNPFGNP